MGKAATALTAGLHPSLTALKKSKATGTQSEGCKAAGHCTAGGAADCSEGRCVCIKSP